MAEEIKSYNSRYTGEQIDNAIEYSLNLYNLLYADDILPNSFLTTIDGELQWIQLQDVEEEGVVV